MPSVGAGFDVLRREPLAALVWGAIGAGLSLLPYLVGIAIVGPSVISLNTGSVDTRRLETVLAGTAIPSLLNIVVLVATTAILTPAIYRAVLTPEDRRHFFLRWGQTEFHMAVLSLVVGVLFVIGAIVSVFTIAVPLGLVFAVGAMAGLGAGIGAVSIGFLVGVGIFLGMAWLLVRLWMAAPMTVAEHHLRVFEGWGLSKGYGWPLVGVNILLLLIVVVIYLLVGIVLAVVFTGSGIAPDSISRTGLAGTLMTAGMVVGLPLLVLITSVVQVIFVAPWAKSYQIIAQATGRTVNSIFD